MAGFLACYFKFFLTTTTVFVIVFVIVLFFLSDLLLDRGLGGASYRLLRLGRLDLRSGLVLLLSFYGCC
ncbi:hypothetical protein C6351_07710 [Bacillus thuringiensis]|nr:hypothetical protein C6351_07710 [Bacillus thuringiensis]